MNTVPSLKQSTVLRGIIYLFAISFIHHIYGEFGIYKDGLRLTMTIGAFIPLMISIISYFLYKKTERKIFAYIFFGIAIFMVIVIGGFESFYSHLVLDILYWLNVSQETLGHFFLRTKPGDILFEITGILQLPFAILLAYYLNAFKKYIR